MGQTQDNFSNHQNHRLCLSPVPVTRIKTVKRFEVTVRSGLDDGGPNNADLLIAHVS